MKSSEKIVNDIFKKESKELIKQFELFLKKKKIHLGFQEELNLIDYLLVRNNRLREFDRAIISFRKLKTWSKDK